MTGTWEQAEASKRDAYGRGTWHSQARGKELQGTPEKVGNCRDKWWRPVGGVGVQVVSCSTSRRVGGGGRIRRKRESEVLPKGEKWGTVGSRYGGRERKYP